MKNGLQADFTIESDFGSSVRKFGYLWAYFWQNLPGTARAEWRKNDGYIAEGLVYSRIVQYLCYLVKHSLLCN